MIKRFVGKTGLEASIIGLGGEHLDNKPFKDVNEVISAAIDNGINIMDMFMPGKEVRENIGAALKGRRDKIMIQGAIGSVDLNEQYDTSRDLNICRKYFEDMLKFLNTDYIDFGLLFYLDNEKEVNAIYDNGIVNYVQNLKKQGYIRAIGASSHNPDMAKRLVEDGIIDMLMFSINPAFDMMSNNTDDITKMLENINSVASSEKADNKRLELYRLCESKGVGITVMKSLGAGKLISKEHTPFSDSLTVTQCIHYCLTRPAVASVLVGCANVKEVENAVKYLDASETEKDYSRIISSFKDTDKKSFRGSCVYCNHCRPCPRNINIASVHKYFDIALLDENNIPSDIINKYNELSSKGSNCIECGSCERKCPFGVPVIKNMRKAAALLG